MNREPAPFERPIHARIHDSALERVTRFFTAGLADIFNELFQNARRAGATRIHVHVEPAPDGEPALISILDDGAGIADPALLLSFGENGWSRSLVAREDAAGMGFLALARRGCTVRSRPRSANGEAFPGWRVELRPEHFLGEAEATVRRDEQAPWPHGSVVSFTGDETCRGIRAAAGGAARHLPLPVHLQGLPDSPPDGERLERRDFLAGAIHTERWRGIAFGVFRNRRRAFHDHDANFHGITVAAGLPEVRSATNDNWSVRVDIQDCPHLELVLPARRTVVQTPFLGELRGAARLCIYRAMAAHPSPAPAFEDWKRAREAGIRIEAPIPRLRPWRPSAADRHEWTELPQRSEPGPDALVVDFDPDPPESQAFYRGAVRAGIAHRLFETDRALEGYDWYDRLDRAESLRTEVLAEGRSFTMEHDAPCRPEGCEPSQPPVRPEDILVTLSLRSPGKAARSYTFATDLALPGDPFCGIDDVRPLATLDSDLQPGALVGLLQAAYFDPSDEADADSWETQRERFRQDALKLATQLLCGEEEALRQTLLDAAERDFRWLVPPDRTATVAIRGRKVSVTLDPPPPPPETVP